MPIANPIYDVVFKYLLDDNKVAKKLISLIIGEEIVALEFKPTEHRSKLEGKSFTVLHLDFAATIECADGGHKQVIIEIQKAKLSSDIMRFRRNLGSQYADKKNRVIPNGKVHPIPILSIYFLGHRLNFTSAPVIKVNRTYIDIATGEEITQAEEFIESLTPCSFVIQISELKKRRRNVLEQVLSIFEQTEDAFPAHILSIREEDYPEAYREVIFRLQKAALEPDVRETMDIEDDILEELGNLERLVEQQRKALEELEEKEKALEEKRRALEEKRKALEEKRKALEEKDKALEEQGKSLEEALSEKENVFLRAVQALVDKGMSEAEARKLLGA